MRTPIVIRVWFAVWLTSLSAACSQIPENLAYSEPEQPSNELATLKAFGSEPANGVFNTGHLYVISIDDKLIDTSSGPFGQTEWKVQPGPHELSVDLKAPRPGIFAEDKTVRLEVPILVEAGRLYAVRGSWSDNLWYVWVEDTVSGTTAGKATIFQAGGN